MVERYYNEDGEVGILVSYGYGAGWSTWNDKELAYDKRIIEKWLEKVSADEMCSYVKSLGYIKPYMGGYKQLELVFVPRGTLFRIDEYDGAEALETFDNAGFIMA